MDASRLINVKEIPDFGLSRDVVARMDLADAMRDMADEIEAGTRLVKELLTYEQVRSKEHPVSVLHLVSVMNEKAT